MKIKKYRYFVGDFETTVFKGQTYTEVWASAIVELFSEEVQVHHTIKETFDYITSLNENIVVYYHNLKFDGSFWLSYLITELNLKQAYEQADLELATCTWTKDKFMKNNTFKYSISDKGQWYSITIKYNNHFIEIRDSLKLLPFSVKRIGEGFKTKHQKLDMEYTGFRYAGCAITDEEKEYIKNDVLVVKEALEVMFKEGHNKLTIGACCLEEYKNTISKQDYEVLFPDLTAIELDTTIYKYHNADEYIRKSYKGGWCYVVKGKTNQVKEHGTTADVNSLYPSMMSSKSGNRYPYGKPCFWHGNYIPDEALRDNTYYFVRIRTKFKIKHNHLPFIQIKGTHLYKGTECLETSDYYNREDGRYYDKYYDDFGNLHDTTVELVLTMTDYELIKEHYELYDFEILDGCWFYALVGIFDEYIDKYAQLKMTSKGALRELAKLFLNNLYGKLATNSNSSFKVAYKKEDGSIGYYTVIENSKKVGYIACGSAITSYARNFTIRAAQKNYHGVDKAGFIYADTDSIHCDLPPEEITGIDVDDVQFCCWKLESCWDEAIFTRQKTYIEHVTHENLKPIKQPYYNVKCAGMPNKCKDLFVTSMTAETIENTQVDFTNKDELKFLSTKRNLTDFKIGLKVPGKLRPVRIKGGILLVDTTYEMR